MSKLLKSDSVFFDSSIFSGLILNSSSPTLTLKPSKLLEKTSSVLAWKSFAVVSLNSLFPFKLVHVEWVDNFA